MRRYGFLASLVLSAGVIVAPLQGQQVQFERTKISDEKFEAASAADVNRDGKIDIISGGFWYEGPEFATRHKIWEVPVQREYHDDFLDYPMDVNGDGYVDIITGGWFGKTLRWIENPGGPAEEWALHDIGQVGPVETARFWDVDGDGQVEVCPNAGGNVVFFRLVRDAAGKGTGQFTKHVVKIGGVGHGLGFGDINGDGRGDFVAPKGWLEAPEDPLTGEWQWHEEADVGHAGVPILVYDVNGDGRNDLIVSQAHSYGLAWWEQGQDDEGKRTWTKHAIDDEHSQCHDLALADIDNDGEVELITGKRYRAHNGGDPGSGDPLGVYYYNIDGGRFERVIVNLGPPGEASGVGIYFWVEDVDGNGWKDIIAPGKDGLYLFKNQGVR